MTNKEPIETSVCVATSATQAEEYAVVLAASGIAHWLEVTETGWALIVAAREGTRYRGCRGSARHPGGDNILTVGSIPRSPFVLILNPGSERSGFPDPTNLV